MDRDQRYGTVRRPVRQLHRRYRALRAGRAQAPGQPAAIEIRIACTLPLILDAAPGFGDPMHMHRAVNMTEAAGFTAEEAAEVTNDMFETIEMEKLLDIERRTSEKP